MTILYTDTQHTHRVHCDAEAELVRHICQQYMFQPDFFDIVHIDLTGDVEGCDFYDTAAKRRVASMCGALAWTVYRLLAEQFPQLNHHFRQPPSTPPPVLLPKA